MKVAAHGNDVQLAQVLQQIAAQLQQFPVTPMLNIDNRQLADMILTLIADMEKRIPNALALLQQINLPTTEDSAINIATRLNFEAPSPSASPAAAPTAAKSASPAAPPAKPEPEPIPGGTVIDVTSDGPPVGVHEPGAHKPQTNPGIIQTLKGAVSAAGAVIKSQMLHTKREAMKNDLGHN